MARVRILYDVDGWAYHARAQALRKHAPADFVVSMAAFRDAAGLRDLDAVVGDEPVDFLLVLDDNKLGRVREAVRKRGWPAKVIGAWNRGWPQGVPHLYRGYRDADYMIFNNRDCWERTGRWPDTEALSNGVDLDVFRVTRPLETRAPRVLWTGSELYRQLKGYDDLILPMRDRLEAQGLDCDIRLVDSFGRDRWGPEAMAEWYNSGTVLVCASAAEGTPNPALEAAACGCVVVSTRVGNMPDLIRSGVNGYLVERDLQALLEGVQAASARYETLARQMLEDIRAWGWAERSRPYFALFRKLLATDGRPAPAHVPRRPDVFDEVTVFVTTGGAPTVPACLEHLCRQDCSFQLKVLTDVTPLSTAIHQMPETCPTPFYVAVDEHTLLYPHAIRTLWERIREEPSGTALVAGHLRDALTQQCVDGIQIVRREAVCGRPLHDWMTEPPPRLEGPAAGIVRLPATDAGILGRREPPSTPEATYERYVGLARRWRANGGGRGRVDGDPARLLQRFLDNPSETSFFALMGVIAGVLSAAPDDGRPNGASTPADGTGFDALRRFLDEMRHREAPR